MHIGTDRVRIITVTLNPAVDLTFFFQRQPIRGELNRADSVQRAASGKGINVSLALRQIGVSTKAIALLGGAAGAFISEAAERHGLELIGIPIAGETRTNVKVFEVGAQLTTELNSSGPTVTGAELARLMRVVADVVTDGDVMVLSGSVPPGVAPSIYSDIIASLRQKSVRVAVDAQGEPLRLSLAARPYMVKPNRREAEELLGRPIASLQEAAEAAREMRALGATYVLLSMGADGAVLCGPDGAWIGTPPTVAVQGTTGCGDALLAGVLAYHAAGCDGETALRAGIAIATATAELPGTSFAAASQAAAMSHRVEIRAAS